MKAPANIKIFPNNQTLALMSHLGHCRFLRKAT